MGAWPLPLNGPGQPSQHRAGALLHPADSCSRLRCWNRVTIESVKGEQAGWQAGRHADTDAEQYRQGFTAQPLADDDREGDTERNERQETDPAQFHYWMG